MLFCVGTSQLSSIEEKVDAVFTRQQQILQQLDSISGCLHNVSCVLGLELNADLTSRVSQHVQPSTPLPGPLIPTTRAGCVLPQTSETPATITPTTTILPQSTPGSNTEAPPLPVMPLVARSNRLLPPSEVVAKYPRLRGDCKMGELATKLARESFFGKELMQRSTVMGFKEFPALPADGVQALKGTILSVCPDYHCNPHGFEGIWKKCVDAINHACSKLRK